MCHFTLACPFHPNKGQTPTEGFIHTDNFWAKFLPEIRFGWVLTTTRATKLPQLTFTQEMYLLEATILRKFLTSLSYLIVTSITSYLLWNLMNLTSRHFCSSCPSLSNFSFSQKILFSKKIPYFPCILILPLSCLVTCTSWTLLSHTILIFFQLHRYCLISWYIKSETTGISKVTKFTIKKLLWFKKL